MQNGIIAKDGTIRRPTYYDCVFVRLSFYLTKEKEPPSLVSDTITMSTFTLTSKAFDHNSEIPQLYTCDGENINPPLEVNGAPALTKSFVLITDDPDAPRGTFTHWTMWNIPGDTALIGEDSVPEGNTGITTAGTKGYRGPCPPEGAHRYFFKLYALDTKLSLPDGAERNVLEQAMEGHILAETHLMGLYRRQEEAY